MTRVTFLQRVAIPLAIMITVLCTVGSYYKKAQAGGSAGASLGEALGAFVYLAAIHAPLCVAPLCVRRSLRARAMMAGLLLPTTLLLAAVVCIGAVQLAFDDRWVWAAYLSVLASLIVHAIAVAVLLWPDRAMHSAVLAV